MEQARRRVIDALVAAGCVAPSEESEELLRAAELGVGDLEDLLARRVRGEPLAWIVGSVGFCDLRLRVDPGVYVPRPHTEALARRAASLLPPDGIGVDLCTGCGSVAAVMRSFRPDAEVLGTDIDPVAIACAERNGVTALLGDLDEPLPATWEGLVDVLTAVVPYVPTGELHLLPRDVTAFEPRLALDGGTGGIALLERVARLSPRWLRPGGHLLLELGGDQARTMSTTLGDVGLTAIHVHRDDDGRDRMIEAVRP